MGTCTSSDSGGPVAAVTALDTRCGVPSLTWWHAADTAVSRDEAAQALGSTRRAAAFHLDRLADEGLLAVEFRHTGRTGPGRAGRPSSIGGPRTRSR